MALGTLGSTLNDELNRLANGGTYRTMNQMVDEALAAKQWANRENINPYSTDTVGILNEIAGLGLDKKNWLDFNGVCNYIAGTTGLPAAAALRQVYPTTDLLTGVASYYVDGQVGSNYIPTTASGFMYLPGVAGNYASAPDSSALDITGDIDLRVKVALDNWIPNTTQELINKFTGTGNQRGYRLLVQTTGNLQLIFSPDGASTVGPTSTVIPGFANGATKWVRVTLDVNNGASGNDAIFYTSDDGTNWTQLGATVTNSGTTSIFANTQPLNIGAIDNGATFPVRGKIFRAQVLNGINGTVVFDANFETAMTSQTVTSFTESSSNAATVTVNRNTYNFQLDTIANLGAAGSLLPTTLGSSTAADSNDPKFLDHTGTNYVYTPGVVGNYLQVPDSNDLDITGDLDLRAYVALDDWTASATQWIISKWLQATNNRSYTFGVNTNGTLQFSWSTNGTAANSATSTVAPTVSDGAPLWIRVTLDVDNGASGNDVKFFTSTNGTTWTQLGSTVTAAGTTSIFASTATVLVGQFDLGSGPSAGKFFRAQIFNGIDGTKVLDVDTSVITAGSATSFTAVTGQTVTIVRSTSGRKTVAVTQPTWLFGTDDYMEVNNRYTDHLPASENYVYLSGASGNYLSVADNPPLDVTGDIDIQVKMSMDDWTPSNLQTVISKYTFPNRSWGIEIQDGSVFTAGLIRFVWSEDGSTTKAANSTVPTGLADGATKWIRVTLDVNNGAGGNDVKFFLSDNGTTWTQLGSTVTQAGTTSIYSGTSPLWIGSLPDATSRALKGKLFRAIVKDGIDGTTVLDANTAVITTPTQTTFTDSSSNAYTVTINRSGVGTFVSTNNYLYLPGVLGNDATSPDSAAVSVTGDIDMRVKVAMDDWTPSASSAFLTKWAGGTGLSYYFYVSTTGFLRVAWTANNSTTIDKSSTVATGFADGTTKWVRATIDVDNGAGGNDVAFYTSDDGTSWTQLGATVTTTGTTSIFDGTTPLRIGSAPTGDVSRGKFFRAQVLNGINGTVAFDANFETSITSLNQASFTESSANAATVTINRSGSAYRSAGITAAGYLYPGATNTFAASATDHLNFGASDSFTAMVVVRNWVTTNDAMFMAKSINGITATMVGYVLWNNTTGSVGELSARIGDGTNRIVPTAITNINGANKIALLIRNVTSDTVNAYINTTTTSASDTTTGSLSNIATLLIGQQGSGSFQPMEFYAAAIFRQALTATQIRQISNYFANREVYL